MFLKRIEMQGFKSFADRTVITFDHPITAIVGPNGCGKSNIADAVRWVLGEQSAKSMRGQKMDDVIFAGSADRRRVNMAEVTLVFDNSNHSLNSSQNEVEVTRRLYRESGDAEYLINRRQVRLRDVVDLFLDTGIGRDSLSMISQGNVISFAEAKPFERRAIFEEAAGVAKYKKRKVESISRLERTKVNLDRSTDILNELEKQVSPLKRQARKAEIYREKKERLQQIEITVLVRDIENLNNEIDQEKKSLLDMESRSAVFNTNIQVLDAKVRDERQNITSLDRKVSDLQEELMKNVQQVQSLEQRRTELNERRKYIVQTGNGKQKAEELASMTETARVEYEDRKKRLDELNAQIRLGSDKLNQAAQQIMDRQSEVQQADHMVRTLENRSNVLEQLMQNPFNNQQGIRSIMENRNALHGICGVIGQVLQVEHGYEEAISTALGGAMNNIVTKDEQAARDAIRFLTRNLSGRATFLPLTVCRPRYISREHEIICNNTDGYLGAASAFVKNDPLFDPVVMSLLNNVLVVKDMETGNHLSALTNRMYKIVTLDGEVIHRGGSMTGGKARHSTNIVTMKKEYADIKIRLDSETAKQKLAHQALEKAEEERHQAASQLQESRYAAAALEPVVDAKQAKYEKLKNDLAMVNPEDAQAGNDHEDDLIRRLNEAYSRRDEITTEIRNDRSERQSIDQDVQRKEAQLRQQRKELQQLEQSINALKIEQGKYEGRLETSMARLTGEYQMTYEYALEKAGDEPVENARQEVAALRADIDRLGSINMNAPEEYSEVNERYETMKSQIEELTLARDKILASINEMDTVMKKQFKETFDKINVEFNNVFQSLYGGGSAKLILQDPSDLLNTGIEIDAQPPGKAVHNNMLFSGGEKSLIALCVLFAILKVKPVPLVILDEVEAALDPGNVERFAQYLHNYTDQTQFIVVTHRQGTMEKADVLYGVTMQHQGVSQMLKVELKDAVSMAESDGGRV